MTKQTCSLLLLAAYALCSAGTGVAAPRIIDANCARNGCFSGDAPGLPVQILEAGSYRFASNLYADPRSPTVIEIHASNVSLDLDGFSIIGENECLFDGESVECAETDPVAAAIWSAFETANVSVFNGQVQGVSGTGILLNSSPARVEDLLVDQVGRFGIALRFAGIVRDCVVQRAGEHGFYSSSGGLAVLMRDSVVFRSNGGFLYGSAANVVELQSGGGINVRTLDGSFLDGQVVQP